MNGITFQKGYYKIPNSLIIWVVLLIISVTVTAQSGRKTSKRTEAVPQSTSSPSESSTQVETPIANSELSAKPASSKLSLLIGSNIPQTLYLQFPFPEKMQRWVVERLSKSPILNISTVGDGFNRKEAVKRAKSETQVLTVLLELEENFLEVPRANQRRAQTANVWINYYIFLPESGKSKYHGRVYLNHGLKLTNGRENKTGISCYPNTFGDDLLLLEASIEVSNRIMSDLSLGIPPICSSNFQ